MWPILTLTTDFGLADHYVGTMKGVLLSRCPDAHIIDISHEIPAFSIHAGAYAIDQAAPFFPSQTVHVIVVDPGVGTMRRALLLEALGQHFVAPDNGVISMIAARDGNWKAYEITNQTLWAAPRSSTFHGRDLFAPAAAAIASGAVAPEHVGPQLREIVLLRDLEAREIEPGLWRGLVLSVDHFGNVITNFRAASLPDVANSPFMLELGDRKISQFCKTFGDAAPNVCFAYFGSSGYVEIGINQRSAAEFSGIAPGDPASLRLRTALKSN